MNTIRPSTHDHVGSIVYGVSEVWCTTCGARWVIVNGRYKCVEAGK